MAIVYILTNEAMPGLIKIGRTANDLEKRIGELNRHSGVPLPFECYYAREVTDEAYVERMLHEAFSDHRIRKEREFFRISPYKAQCALQIAEGREVTPKGAVIDDNPQDAEEAIEKENKRRDRWIFSDFKIPAGAILRFTKDTNITAVVKDGFTIEFRGEDTTLSGAALVVLGEMGYRSRTARGGAYWEYEGETIMDRAQRLRELNQD
jgi:RNase P/RNase MRP subunit p29